MSSLGSLDFAREKDRQFPSLRDRFYIPTGPGGKDILYFIGNSLGLQPKHTQAQVQRELDVWAAQGAEALFNGSKPWLRYSELISKPLSQVVGALPDETLAMNGLTVNLHLMLSTFYRPTSERSKILMEANPFPSDRYAVSTHVQMKGLNPHEVIQEVMPRQGERTIRPDDLMKTIESEGDGIAVILLGNVNYLTGQAFRVEEIVRLAHRKGCTVGLDLAHGIGNLVLQLHDWDVDFAVWCHYKYLCAGPGAIGGCFIHSRHGHSPLPRLAGWWGQNKRTQFKMDPEFDPEPGAAGWQISSPPIFQMAALMASLELYEEIGMPRLRERGTALTQYLEDQLRLIPSLTVVTPKQDRGSQLSVTYAGDASALVTKLQERGVICDFREPDIIRITPSPLYTRFEDVLLLSEALRATT